MWTKTEWVVSKCRVNGQWAVSECWMVKQMQSANGICKCEHKVNDEHTNEMIGPLSKLLLMLYSSNLHRLFISSPREVKCKFALIVG